MSGRKKSSDAAAENGSVEQLLQAAHDEMLLELSVDSHMSRVAADYLDPDLSRRFQAIRSRPSSSHSQQKKQLSAPAPPLPKPQPEQKEDEEKKERKSKVVVADYVDEELKAVLGDDLSARFAALKSYLSSSSSNPTAAITSANDAQIGLEKSEGEDDEEDEVERVIQWAKDAARLDPSPDSDDDDYLIGSDSDDKDTDYDDDPKFKKKETKPEKMDVVYALKKQAFLSL